MRNLIAAVAIFTIAIAPTASEAQQVEPVPESIHSKGDGDADVCGFRASSVADLEIQIRALEEVEALDQAAEYSAYAVSGLRQLTFTKAANRAHPAVACRQVVARQGGGSTIQTSIACFSSRENCDWLYREFEALTKRMTDAMNGS